jgi:hypothetical protein
LQELLRNDRDALLQQTGLAFSTDADGRCRVPLGTDATHVSAVKDELWGQGYLRKGATESTVILLRADRTLHVLVVDAGGKPVRGSMVVGTRKHGSRTTNSQMGETTLPVGSSTATSTCSPTPRRRRSNSSRACPVARVRRCLSTSRRRHPRSCFSCRLAAP